MSSKRTKMSIQQLANKVGLSTATVSRALNQREGVGSRTRDRVLHVAREMGYQPRVSARTTTIGLVMDRYASSIHTGSAYVSDLTVEVMAELARHHLTVKVFSVGNLETLDHSLVDGVLAIAWQPDTLAALHRLQNVPVLIFDRPDLTQFSCVTFDEEACGRMAAEHLIAYGHQRLGYLDIQHPSYVGREMPCLTGFRRVIREAGFELPDARIGMVGDQSPFTTLQRVIREGVTGLFVPCRHLTLEIPYYCSEALRLRIPEQLSLIGFNVSYMMKFNRPPLTLMAPPVKQMSQTAVSMLDELIHSFDYTPRTVRLQPELISRDSVSSPSENSGSNVVSSASP